MTSRFRVNSGVRVALVLGCALGLSACVEGQSLFGSGTAEQDFEALTPSGATRLVERDVEAPEVFQVTTTGLWDGRPSLGGVWVAHPDAVDPERVLIRNEENDLFVIGALFRRERDNPGPALMVSSDAAAALNILAGSPTLLNVTALRREETAPADPEPLPEGDLAETATAGAVPAIEMQSLDALSAAAAAIDESEAVAAAAPPAPDAPAVALAPAAAGTPAPLERPFIQIGIFSIEQNANNIAQSLRTAGMIPTIYDQTSNDRRFWRVVIGPARDEAERAVLLETVRGLGFQDAYFVTN